jgi:hypothetical protein
MPQGYSPVLPRSADFGGITPSSIWAADPASWPWASRHLWAPSRRSIPSRKCCGLPASKPQHFRLATIGRAFHWMDRADTLARLDRMIDPEGAVALFGDRHPEVPDNRWRRAYDMLLDRYSAADTARAQRKSPDWPRHETILLDSVFRRLERVSVIERRETPVDRIVERMLSLSSVSHAQIGAKADDLARELRTAMSDFAQDGTITEVVESEALIARREV